MTSLWHPFAAMGVVQDEEFVVDRADDVWIWDEEGRRYLDATAGLWYSNVGHGRAEIISAVVDQMSRLDAYQVFGDFANRPALTLAERLCALAPGEGWKAFLGSGGGDGIDTAIKLSRRYFHAVDEPRRRLIVTRESSYHGAHGWGTAIAGIPVNREGFGPPIDESVVVARSSLEELESAFLAAPGEIAAVLAEPVIGAGGVYPPAPGYLQGVQRLCREHGALFVVDVVICGFGRLGTWLGFERFDLEPDMIVFAKGVTSGYQPLGGVLVSGPVAEPFFAGTGHIFRHGATYAGHPAACAAALANLDILEREDLPARVPELERLLEDALVPLASHPLVAEVRGGVGLLAAVEFSPAALATHPALVQEVFAAVRRRGVIVRPLAGGLAVSPPLTVELEQLHLIAAALRESLDEIMVAV
jgi:putrescine---pyruvate transaminase